MDTEISHKVFSEPHSGELKGIIEKIGYNYNIDIVVLEIPEDHLHRVVLGVPRMSPSDVMQIIKSIMGFIRHQKSLQISPELTTGGFVPEFGSATDPCFGKYDSLWIAMLLHSVTGGLKYRMELCLK